MSWVGFVASVGEKRNTYGILGEKSESGKEHLEDLYVHGKIILKYTLKWART
jgi:hypothetical protein